MLDIAKDLDLFGEQKIEFIRRQKDFSDVVNKSSEFTKSFQGPASAKNQAALQFYGLLGTMSDFNPHQGIAAQWSFNTIERFIGRLEVVSVAYKDGKPYSISFNFYGKQRALSTVFGSDRFSDVDFSSWTHNLTGANVKNSWSGDLFDGDLVYPLIDNERGYFFGPSDLNLAGNIANENNPILLPDLRPAVRFPRLMEKIFEEYGLTLDGDIITDPNHDFNNVYILLNRFSGRNRSAAEINDYFCQYVGVLTSELTSVNTEAIINATTLQQDNLGLWDGNTYETPFDGLYNHTGKFVVNLTGTFVKGRYRIERRLNGVVQNFWQYDNLVDQPSFELFCYGGTQQFAEGDLIEYFLIRLPLVIGPDTFNGQNCQIDDDSTASYIRATVATVFIGLPYSLNNQMPDIKLVDWISSFIESLNWLLVPDSINETKWTLISSADYKAQGEVRDWTGFVNVENMVFTKPEVYKEINFKYKESGSAIHKAYSGAMGRGFGQLKINPDVEFANNRLQVENPCSIIPPSVFKVVDDQGSPTGENADITIYKSLDLEGGNVVDESLMFYYNGLKATSSTWYFQNQSTPNGVQSEEQNEYPQISSFRETTPDGGGTSLCFSIESDRFGNIPTQTIYKRYWESDIQLQFDPMTRVMKQALLILPAREFYSYQMNDEIFCENQYWRIIEIKHDKDGRKATATLMTSRRTDPTNEATIKGGGRITFTTSPSKIDLGAVGAFRQGSDYYGSFLVVQITPDLLRYNEIITQVNTTVINEINDIEGRFRTWDDDES